MSSAVEKALESTRAFVATVQAQASQQKAAAFVDSLASGGGSPMGSFGEASDQRKTMQRYSGYRGWAYSVIHFLATRAAQQPLCVGQLKGDSKKPEPKKKLASQKTVKASRTQIEKMPPFVRSKAAMQEIELYMAHPVIDVFARNPLQNRIQLVYTFVAQLALTGQAYLIADQTKDGPVVYCLPTSWVVPKHDKGPFSSIEVKDPKAGEAKSAKPVTYSREQFGRAYMPDPSDPMGSLAPLNSQSAALEIDSAIQECQVNFFDNGIFPSVAIAMGSDPHPDAQPSFRPRLTGPQRQQVHAAINRMYADTRNYGLPIIIDGMVESVTPLSRSQDEIGWEKSEGVVKNRIVSPFGVHPFMLGEAINVGGYAQANVIERQTYERVNFFLAMLSELMTDLWRKNSGETDTVVYWEEAVARDDSLYSVEMREARKAGDISKNEYRAYLGLPPDEEAAPSRAALLDTVGGMTGAVQILSAMGNRLIDPAAAQAALAMFFQISDAEAARLVGAGPPPAPEAPAGPPAPAPAAETPEPPVPDDELAKAVAALREAVLAVGPVRSAEQILEAAGQVAS